LVRAGALVPRLNPTRLETPIVEAMTMFNKISMLKMD